MTAPSHSNDLHLKCHICQLGLNYLPGKQWSATSLQAAALHHWTVLPPHTPGLFSLFAKTPVKTNSMLSRWPVCMRTMSPKGMRDVQREFFPPTSWQEGQDETAGCKRGLLLAEEEVICWIQPFYFYKGGLWRTHVSNMDDTLAS